MLTKNRNKTCSTIMISSMLFFLFTSCAYMKMDPPADADKTFFANNNSCFQATAANMLAGAGYGTGASLQARADAIYVQMTNHFGTANTGWIDTALSWWLGSANNTWAGNPYTLVTLYGNKIKIPWANPNGAMDMGNYMRSCSFVGLSISWPTTNGGIKGHAITCWGDNGRKTNAAITNNPSQVRVTDSDTDTGGNLQVYNYDSYTSPNPGGPNVGNGWYFNYGANHPFIKHIVTLSPVTNAAGNPLIQRVVGTYKIHQTNDQKATDLHYKVGTDVEILSYKTEINWISLSNTSPSITEIGTPRKQISVDWDFNDNPIPQCNWVTITTEFILRYWNAIYYDDVYFTYPDGSMTLRIPSIGWKIDTERIDRADSIPNVTGGYLVGAFDIINPALPKDKRIIGEYRFSHQYSYIQNPEKHLFGIKGEKGLEAANFRFGHSYGYLKKDQLWKFENWMTKMPEKTLKLGDRMEQIAIDWTGKLPYPEGEVVPDWMRNEKPRNK